jgi:alkylation response protein AidB-like acyl-CoA dehydrogenase
MSYKYSYRTRDIKFCLKEWLPTAEVLAYDRYKDYYSVEDLDMIIDQVRKIAAEVLAPIADDGETIGATWKDGQAYIPPSWHKAYRFIQDNGWGTSNMGFDTEGALPTILYGVLYEIMIAANPAFMPYVSTASGVARMMQLYCSDDIKALFLDKLLSGEWGGTMCITEPTAGSDAGDALSKAYPTDDPRIYKIKGQKIFITSGDRDDLENIVHMYMARIEGAKPGTKGLSMFVVPKKWVNEDGSLSDNDFQCIGIEHKMGLKGSATAALVAGENNNCRGWLVGDPPDAEGNAQGMAQMFNMMNGARLDTGRCSLAVMSNAYWNATEYGKERVQGHLLTNPKAGRQTINKHEDVKRMYLVNKATTEACRALLTRCYYYQDVANWDPDPQRREWAQDRIDVITPLCKAYPSDEAWPMIAESIQSFGGYGFCEDYPVANAARDCKIWSIWEGTNYIQSLDLIGRKWNQKKGKAFAESLQEIADWIAANKGNIPGFDREMAHLEKAFNAYKEIQKTMWGYMKDRETLGFMGVYARRVLTATAQLWCGWLLMDQAIVVTKRLAELAEDHYEYPFYKGKALSIRYYLNNVVPNVWHLEEIIKMADTSVLEATDDIFEY